MRALIPFLIILLLMPCAALAGEGDPLLSVDELQLIADSYEAFLFELGDIIVSRGLLSPEERDAWHDAQMGDFYQNGGYGSILANYMPGMLSFVREEDTLLVLRTQLGCGLLEISTVRRYTPQDSSLPGLMLSPSLFGTDGTPRDVTWQFSSSSGMFLKWDPVTGAYENVGVSAQSAGETVCFSNQTPAENAQNPTINIDIFDAVTAESIGQAQLILTVDGDGYLLTNEALSGM